MAKEKFTREQFEKLPSQLKDALSSGEKVELIEDLSKRHNLHVDQTGQLVVDINAIIAGAARPDDFFSMIKQDLSIDDATANDIAEDVNRTIILPIREVLKKMWNGETIAEPETEEEGESLDRSSILDSIEHPVMAPSRTETTIARLPAGTPQNSITLRKPGTAPSAAPALPVQPPKFTAGPAIPPPPPPPSPLNPGNIAAAKLSGPVNTPKSYSVDPYREPPKA